MAKSQTKIRQYFHFKDLEEFTDGMWRIVRGEERRSNAARAAELMRAPSAFKSAMQEALHRWPKSCAHNLTSENSNRLAWLGHAGCFLTARSPEENTRIGWHSLSPEQQAEANKVASDVLKEWLASGAWTGQLELWP